MSTDLSTFGCISTRCLNAQELDGAFMGNGIFCDLVLTSGSNVNAVLNEDNRINLMITYGAGGTSTLGIFETQSGPFRGSNMPNLRIAGVADPTADQDASTKAYVDSHINDVLNIRECIKAYSDQDVSGQGGYAYTANNGSGPGGISNSTIVFNLPAPAVGFSNPNPGTSVDVDGVTLLLTERILLVNTAGGGVGTGDAGDGVYTLTSVGAGASFTLTFTRSTDLDDFPLEKGNFVLTDAGSLHAGNGYFLNADTANSTVVQPWVLFSTQHVQTFVDPIVLRGINYTVAGDAGGADEGKVLIGGTAGQTGIGQWSYIVGKTGNAFTINGTNVTVTDAGTFTTTAVTGVTLVGPTTLITSTTSTTIDATGGITLQYGNSHKFSKVATGSVAVAIPTIAVAQTGGHIVPLTDEFLDASGTAQFGAGVLFDSEVNFNGPANVNGGRYLMCPRNTGGGANTVTLDILKFDNAGAAVIVAQITP